MFSSPQESEAERVSELAQKLAGKLVPPTKEQELLISQIICAGEEQGGICSES